MSTLSLRLPESVHHGAREYARREGVSINQLIATAVAEKLAALTAEDYIARRAARANEARFAEALATVPDAAPQVGDEWPTQAKEGL